MSMSMPKNLNIADSMAAEVPNAQHDPIRPWSLTGVDHPQSRKSNLEGTLDTSMLLFNRVNFIPLVSTIDAYLVLFVLYEYSLL